jgi:adenylosuccinate synthase
MLKWVPTRCRELGIDPKHPRIKKCWDLLGDWKKNLETFEAYVPTRRDEDILDEEHLIFEGAQGLLLAQDRLQDFPHLTRSNTGLRNVASLVPDDFEYRVNYVTRAYTTRHGNGPLPHEVEKLEGYSTLDTTNLTNKHQGKLRFSPLDLDTIRLAVVRDIRTYGNQEGWHVRAVVTCLDQAPRLVDVVDRGTKIQVEREDLGDYVRRAFIADEVLETWEP